MEALRVAPRQTTAEEHAEGVRQAQVLFKLNHMMPYTDEYDTLVCELFGENLGEGGTVMPGLAGVCFDNVHIGRNVLIMNNCLMMARGGITIEDGAMIAANVQLIANNHDLQDRTILLCKPVRICRNAWIGAVVVYVRPVPFSACTAKSSSPFTVNGTFFVPGLIFSFRTLKASATAYPAFFINAISRADLSITIITFSNMKKLHRIMLLCQLKN